MVETDCYLCVLLDAPNLSLLHFIDGQMTAGQLGEAIITYITYTHRGRIVSHKPSSLAGFCMYAAILSESIGGVSESVGGFLKAQGSGARLFSLLDESSSVKSMSVDLAKTQPIKLSANFEPIIRFQNIQFSFPTHPSVQVLNDVSFSLLNGELLGLTGSSGKDERWLLLFVIVFGFGVAVVNTDTYCCLLFRQWQVINHSTLVAFL